MSRSTARNTYARAGARVLVNLTEPDALPARQALHTADEPDEVALGILELGDRRPIGDVHRVGDLLAAQLLGLGQGGADVVDLNVEGDIAVALLAGADAAADAGPVLGRGDHAVVHGVVGVDVPAEEVAVVALELLGVGANHLEVDDGVSHCYLLFGLRRVLPILPVHRPR